MTGRRNIGRDRAEEYVWQAVSLQRGAEMLLASNYPHPAHLLACHGAINAGDAIVLLQTGDTHTGDHRRSAEALLAADRALVKLAESLGRLSEEKNTIAYRPATRDVPSHERAVRDSREIVEEACYRTGVDIPGIVPPGQLTTASDLADNVRAVLTDRRLDPQEDPWETLLVVLELLAGLLRETSLGEFAEQVRSRRDA